MRLLLDEGLPRSAARLLTDSGIDTVHAGDIGLLHSDDRDILEAARRDHRIVVTLDADFHTHLALSGATAPSTIRIRLEGLRAEALHHLLLEILPQCAAELIAGAAITVDDRGVRIRHLPLIR